MREKRYIVDTTLRDGEQGPGIALGLDEKVKIAVLLDQLQVYEIEAGIPSLGKLEMDSVYRIMQNRKNSLISVWSRMNQEDLVHSISCSPDIIHIGAPVSYVQIYSKLKKNKTWVQKQLLDCVEQVHKAGIKVTVGFEDSSRADIGFMFTLASKLKEAGVDTIRIADTVGVLVPQRTHELVAGILERVDMEVEIHTHNDLGMAVANALEGAKAGAKYLDCTLFGLGERTGNCNFYELVHAGSEIFDFGMTKSDVRKVEKQVRELIVTVQPGHS